MFSPSIKNVQFEHSAAAEAAAEFFHWYGVLNFFLNSHEDAAASIVTRSGFRVVWSSFPHFSFFMNMEKTSTPPDKAKRLELSRTMNYSQSITINNI